MTWKTLLAAEDRELALARIREITAALERASLDKPAIGPGVAGGKAGHALFFGYLYRAGLGGPGADEMLGAAIDDVAEVTLGPSLYSGFTGVAWTTELLTAEAYPAGETGPTGNDSEDSNEEIDAALLEHTAITPWKLDYDVVNGLVGYGVYALERVVRRNAASARELLERIVERLAELAVETPGSPGVTWWTSPDLMIPETREKSPDGNYNLGVAHGMPGVVALLGAAVGADVAVAKARPLLEGSVAWLLAQRGDGPAQFGYTVEIPPAARQTARSAWCYGAPGIAATLLWAGQCAGEPAWVDAAVDIAVASAGRPAENCGVLDAGVCHGASGLALLFNRLWQASGDERLAAAARDWARRTLAMHRPGEGVGGYLAWYPKGDGTMGWEADLGVLTGAAGIGLSLLACATDVEPTWDTFLLTSPRPR